MKWYKRPLTTEEIVAIYYAWLCITVAVIVAVRLFT